MAEGTLFLVVGPSGAGKDTLIAGAREALKDDPRFVFARRVITRPSDAGGEGHIEIGPEAFETRRAARGFALSWKAHGHDYGLPASLADDLAAGRNVVANVSRAVVAQAAADFRNIRVVVVTAPSAVLAARLAGRGRESGEDIATRLAREGAAIPAGVPCTEILNDASPEEGVRRLVAALTHDAAAPC